VSYKRKLLLSMYDILLKAFGPRGWWPADTEFEVIIGAILTQNTSWKNVKKAIDRLKKEDLLSPHALLKLKEDELADIIRASGYYNQKAKKIKNFLKFLSDNYSLSLEKMEKEDIIPLRNKLLSIRGIGPETADSIILYAFNKPIFVVDAYTYRIFSRHGLIPQESNYDEIQSLFMDNLEPDVELFKEFHALIVYTGNLCCSKSKPKCNKCPLNEVYS